MDPVDPDLEDAETSHEAKVLDQFQKSNRLKIRLMIASVVLSVALIFYVGILVSRVFDDFERRDQTRDLLIERLDENLATVRCFAEYQSRWDAAITDILDPNIAPDVETEEARLRLLEATEDLRTIQNQCLVEGAASQGP